MVAMDKNGDGIIDYEEFLVAIRVFFELVLIIDRDNWMQEDKLL